MENLGVEEEKECEGYDAGAEELAPVHIEPNAGKQDYIFIGLNPQINSLDDKR